MNLIGNNCGSAFYYKFAQIEFNNPFVWCLFTPQDMIYLIQNYENIDFDEIDLAKLDENTFKTSNLVRQRMKEHRNIVGINIDNKITPYYVHYLFDCRCETPVAHGIDVFYKRNYEYVYDKYISRLNRNGLDEQPTFLIIAYSFHGWTYELLREVCNIKTDKKIIIITNYDIPHNSNVHIIHDDLQNLDTEFVTKIHYNDIKSILGE